MTLNKKFTPMIEVDAFDLMEYIADAYNMEKIRRSYRRFEITVASNDTYHRFEVSTEEEFDDYELCQLEQAFREQWIQVWNLDLILRKICADGFLQEGVYLVRVSW